MLWDVLGCFGGISWTDLGCQVLGLLILFFCMLLISKSIQKNTWVLFFCMLLLIKSIQKNTWVPWGEMDLGGDMP